LLDAGASSMLFDEALSTTDFFPGSLASRQVRVNVCQWLRRKI
jgi:hypothetical protein